MKNLRIIWIFMLLFFSFVNKINAQIMESGWYWPTPAEDCYYLGWLGVNPGWGYHLGQDICNNGGSPVYSIGDGEVISSGLHNGYGCNGSCQGGCVLARYQAADGTWFTAMYGHLDNWIGVSSVSAGQIIGYTRTDWDPTHLHFSIHPGYDPEPNNPWRGYTSDINQTYGFTDPIPFLEAHPSSTQEYALSYNAQGIEGWSGGLDPVILNPGQIVNNLWIKVRNDGTATWSNNGGSDSWIALTSCCFNHPDIDCSCSGSYPCNRSSEFAYNWLIDDWRVTYPNESSIGPGEYATFEFSIKAPNTPGDYHEFFHPYHYEGGWIPQLDGGYPEIQFFFRVIDDNNPHEFSGNVSGVWENGWTVTITGNTTVPSGQTLTIQHGVTVKFNGNYSFTVNGTLDVNGSSSSRVVFTKNGSGDWGNFTINTNAYADIDYCDILDANNVYFNGAVDFANSKYDQ